MREPLPRQTLRAAALHLGTATARLVWIADCGDLGVEGVDHPHRILGILEAVGADRVLDEVHHGGNSLNNFANLHVIMAIRNTELFEVLLPDAMQKYGLAQDITVDRDGFVHAPTAPGLGAAIDFELIEKKKIGVLS